MQKLSVLSGYIEGEVELEAPSVDPRFLSNNDSDALERFERERMGCPLRETQNPWVNPEHLSRNKDDIEIGEGQLAFSDRCFEYQRVFHEEVSPCSCQVDPETICPFCKHHALQEGEVCLTRAMPIDLFDRLKIKTKRKAIALSEDGTPLSDEYVAVILQKSEMEEIILKASLPIEYFTH